MQTKFRREKGVINDPQALFCSACGPRSDAYAELPLQSYRVSFLRELPVAFREGLSVQREGELLRFLIPASRFLFRFFLFQINA